MRAVLVWSCWFSFCQFIIVFVLLSYKMKLERNVREEEGGRELRKNSEFTDELFCFRFVFCFVFTNKLTQDEMM